MFSNLFKVSIISLTSIWTRNSRLAGGEHERIVMGCQLVQDLGMYDENVPEVVGVSRCGSLLSVSASLDAHVERCSQLVTESGQQHNVTVSITRH